MIGIIRGILEIAIGVYLVNNWFEPAPFIRWYIVVVFIGGGLLTVLNSYLEDRREKAKIK